MRRRRRVKPTGGVQMFSFLDAMICTMGALLVLLHAFARHGQETVTQKAEERANSAEIKAEREDLQWRIAHLKESRDKSAADLAEQRLKLSHVEDHERRLRDQFRNLKIAAEEMQRLGSTSADEQQHAAAELQAAQQRVLTAQLALDEARKKAQGQASTYSVVPYEGPNATRRRPIYIECRASTVILQPEGIELKPQDFAGTLGPGNPLASALRGMREYLASQAPNQDSEPYPLLLVRPDGIEAYYAARSALDSWGSEFGYELVGGDWKLKFPEPDPRLAELTRQIVAEARERHREYVMHSPQLVRSRSRPTFHANSRGGFSAQPGSGGGRGTGTGGWDSLGSDWSQRDGSGGADDEGGGGSGDSPGGGFAGRGTGASPSAGALQPGGRPGALGSGGDGLDGTGQGLDVAAIGNDLNGRGASRYGEGAGASRYGGGSGGTGFAGSGTGGSPEGRSNEPGSRYGRGSDSSGQDGSTTGGGGSSMAAGVAAGTRDGAEGQGFTTLPGGTTQSGSSKPGGSPGGSSAAASAGGSASGGSSMDSDSAGNQASAGSQSSAGAGGSQGGSPQASGSPGSSAAGQASNVKSMARSRGRDWGLPEVAAVSATRPIRIELHNDRLVIVPESRTELPKEVRLGARTQDSMDEFVSDVWTHMKGWGVAGKGMYWRPTLVMDVKPGAADRYAEIKALLADSGLDIHERRQPTAAKAAPRKSTRK